MYTKYLGTSLSESTQSSSRPNSTADTSKYGSQTVNPRPIKSMAALLIGVCAGNLRLGGCCSKNVNALPENTHHEKLKKSLVLILIQYKT